jgi:hypothetical protein
MLYYIKITFILCYKSLQLNNSLYKYLNINSMCFKTQGSICVLVKEHEVCCTDAKRGEEETKVKEKAVEAYRVGRWRLAIWR